MPHDRGELSIYMKDFNAFGGDVKPAKPTLDPFGSSISIGMSDYPYHTTTYEATLCKRLARTCLLVSSASTRTSSLGTMMRSLGPLGLSLPAHSDTCPLPLS